MSTTVNTLVEKMIDDLFQSYPMLFANQTKSIYVNALQLVVLKTIQKDIELSTVEPDYERIYLQLS